MKDLTVSEKVVVRLLDAAWSHYLTLPVEQRDDALAFRRKLDEAAAVVKMRPVRRAAPTLAPDTRTQDQKDYDFDRLLGGQ